MSGETRCRTTRRWAAVCATVALLVSACSSSTDSAPTATPAPTVTDPGGPVVNVPGSGDSTTTAPPLDVELGDGAPDAEPTSGLAVVDGEPLSEDDAESVLETLPEWDVPDDDTDDDGFDRPPDSLEPPLVGDTVDQPFPPAGDDDPTDQPASGPLNVLRYQPQGDVEVAPFLSVTFDQPMVPLATLEQLDDADVPVVVTPGLDGRWRWIGTRTLRFELEPGDIDRLPAATEYRAEVPAGTTSATGGQLGEAVSWTFTTPAPQVTSFVSESESLPLDPVFVAVFDQRVDPDAVLATIEMTVDGDPTALRLATDDEIEADEDARRAVDQALEARAVAFRATNELAVDAALTITVGPGTPSAEGPLTSTAPAIFRARTFGALEVSRHDCNWGDGCVPGVPFTIEFSNPIDTETFGTDQISVEPEIAGLQINLYGSVLELVGATTGRTAYTVTLSGDLADIYGQTLGDDVALDFEVGPARPALRGFDRPFLTTDPMADDPTVDVITVNHDSVEVTAWGVSPADFDAFEQYYDEQWSDTEPTPPEWPQLLAETVEIDATDDQITETQIDLSDAFNQAGGQLVVRVEPTTDYSQDDQEYWENRPTIAWVQQTTLSVDAFIDREKILIWTTDLVTGEPVGQVPVELLGDGRVATTDDEGLAEIEFGENSVTGLYARADGRGSFLPAAWHDGWRSEEIGDEFRWYLFDDRGIYRPGDTARLTGWVRRLDADDAQLALYDGATAVDYTVWDPQGSELDSGVTELNTLGGFNLAVEIPDNANLGQAWVELSILDPEDGETRPAQANHTFQIQEFRTPEFEVTARAETAAPHFAAEPATVAVDAEYYAGGPLPGADVNWLVATRETNFQPPNQDDFHFGVWEPWWWYGDAFSESAGDAAFDSGCFDCFPGEVEYEEFSGVTDAAGTHYLEMNFDGPDVDLPTTVSAEATVFDVNRQAWTSQTDLLVHPAEYYVGLRSDRAFVEQGTPLVIDAVVTDVDGELVAGRDVDVTAGRLEWVFEDGTWSEEVADTQTCTLVSTDDTDDESMRCEFSTEVGGTYQITAIVTDDTEHRNRTEITQWVTGGQTRPTRSVEQQDVTIVPDRETYAPGDTAELLVQAPFAPAHGVMTVIRDGIISTEAFEAEDGSAVLELEIADDNIPNLTVQVEVTGSVPRLDDDGQPVPDAPDRPAYATGQVGIRIPPISRALDVTATPAADAVEPGDDTSVTIAVDGPDGEPVTGADVAVVVVDEAVLALTGYDLADPLDIFYTDIRSWVNAEYTRASIILNRADLLTSDGQDDSADEMSEDSGEEAASDSDAGGDDSGDAASAEDGAARSNAPQQLDVRDNFEALAVYAPSESTGPDGTVTVDVPLPDNLTRYRVMAVAVDGVDHFGKGESTITARLPLMIRPSSPRFLNFGDEFELPVVVQNQTDDELDVDVAVEGSNLTFTGEAGQRVTVPANDRVEVRFAATTDEVGTARFRVAAVSGEMADAAEAELPVYTPATAEAFATYGVVDEGAIGQPVISPTDVFPQFGGLEVDTSSTALQALTDAVLYLVDYRYDSADAYASRIMAVAALRDVLEAFDAAGLPDPDDLDAQVQRDIEDLVALQNDDGGFPYWQRGRSSIPWVSIQSAHALVLADQAGYDVPGGSLQRALDHIAAIEDFIPTDYPQEIVDTLSAYALYVRNLAGSGDTAKAEALYTRAHETLQLDAIAWLWPSIDNDLMRAEIEVLFGNRAVETPGAATFATDYGEDAYLIAESDRRTDGIILDALITEQPDTDLIPKVVAGLMGNQTNGRWNNVQENAFILLAMHRYFDTFEDVTPDFIARVWLGDVFAAEHQYEGRTTDRNATLVPMSDVVGVGDSTITIQKDGEGRLYYRLGLRYAPSDLDLDPRDEGFVVDRIYEGVDDPDDVTRDADGTWHITAGATVRVELTMVADARRTHVALVDPLPAGLEPLNPALSVTGTTPPEEEESGADSVAARSTWCWCWNWFEHQNLRDDRVEAFTSYLDGGTYEYSYIARATTPGTFVVPPTRAEEIYAPEVFGRTDTARVVID